MDPESKSSLDIVEDLNTNSNGSIEDRVFSIPTLIEKVLENLSPKDLLRCRGVNKEIWRDTAEKLLEIAGLNLEFGYFEEQLSPKKYVGSPKESLAQIEFLERNVVGTWFRNTSQIKTFLDDEKKFSENPFPSKTVIFCVEYSRDQLSEECLASLTELVSKFEENIWHCFVVFQNILSIDRIYGFLEKLLALKHLKFLNIFNNWWPMVWDVGRFKNLPRMEKLTYLQIGGYRYDTCFRNFFLKSELADQIQVLHLDGVASDDFECLNRLPNLKKLVLNQVRQVPFKPTKDSFGKLEDLQISFDLAISESVSLIPVIQWMDLRHFITLRKISLKGVSFRKLRRKDCTSSAYVRYPKLNDVSISYELLRQASGVLPFFAAKFPQWKRIHLYGFQAASTEVFHPPRLGFEPEEGSDEGNNHNDNDTPRKRNVFEQLCHLMWPYLPQSVTTIATDTGEKATRPRNYKSSK